MIQPMTRLIRRFRANATRSQSEYWSEERLYWQQRIVDWYRDTYGLEPDPIQSDPASTPTPKLVNEIQRSNKATPDGFLATGQRTVLFYLQELADHGFEPTRFERILDFGVGLGRLIRHYYPFAAELHGCDVTPSVVRFCQESYRDRAQIVDSDFSPPLPYADSFFDYVYANSVFTHIQTDSLPGWVAEFARITRPGAAVIVSVYGSNRYVGHLSELEFDRRTRVCGYLEWGDAHVRENNLYATEARWRDWWGEHFEFLELRHHFKDQNHLILKRRA